MHNNHRTQSSPNLDHLRHSGWVLSTVVGSYCVAWRGNQEIVLEWRGGDWQIVSHRTLHKAA